MWTLDSAQRLLDDLVAEICKEDVYLKTATRHKEQAIQNYQVMLQTKQQVTEVISSGAFDDSGNIGFDLQARQKATEVCTHARRKLVEHRKRNNKRKQVIVFGWHALGSPF